MLRGQLQKGGFVGLGFNARQQRHIGQRAASQRQCLLQALLHRGQGRAPVAAQANGQGHAMAILGRSQRG